MTMTGLALHGLRHRAGGFLATFLSALLGAVILMAFASLLDTAGAPGVDRADADSLGTTAIVAGGWCLLIVVFAVSSTLTLSVQQRGTEMAVLRSVGATWPQIRRMILGEAVVVALVAALAAVPPGWLAGRLLVSLLHGTGQVGPTVAHRFGPVAVGVGFGVTIAGAAVAALLTARRVARLPVSSALLDAVGGGARPGRGRLVAAAVFLTAGAACGTVTATVMRDKGLDAMQTAGQASIWFAIGLALLAPMLLRSVAHVLAAPVRRFGGVSGELSVLNIRQRMRQSAGTVMPVILFTGIATGTVYMQAIEDTASAGTVPDALSRDIETLNYVVVGMIVLFVAVMLINTLLAATAYRRREFAQQRLAGATPSQLLAMVAMEGGLLAVTGVVFGSLAATVTVLPYSVARTGSWWPGQSPAAYAVIVTAAVVLTLAASVGAARRAISVAAVEAVRA